MEQELLVVEKLDIASFFTNQDDMDIILEKIRESALSEVQSVETAKSRKAIASMAYKVSQSKTILDNAGKDLVSEAKAKIKKIDMARKYSRDFLDSLRDEVRKPLTDWEEAEKEKEEKRIAFEVMNKAWETAIVENDLFDRQKEIEAKEAEIARIQAEKEAEELKRREEEKRKLREEQIRQEAIEQAKLKAQRDAEEAELKIKQAEEAKVKAEQDRVAAIERAKIEKELAIQEERRRLKEEEERKQAEQKAEEDRLKAIEEARIADVEHRRKINREALCDMMSACTISEIEAMGIIQEIAAGNIKHITINY